jgi:hypothetical protein
VERDFTLGEIDAERCSCTRNAIFESMHVFQRNLARPATLKSGYPGRYPSGSSAYAGKSSIRVSNLAALLLFMHRVAALSIASSHNTALVAVSGIVAFRCIRWIRSSRHRT